MAKKGAALQLQIEVETDEEWEQLVQREGLIVVDIYSDWCGPCTGMVGNLKKIKLEIGGDILILAIAKADNIECLERFRNKSEPTWMFISNLKVTRLMFGTNAPKLMRAIADEIAKETKALQEETPREGIAFNQLTDEEQERFDEEQRIIEENARIELEAREKAICDRREAVVDAIKENIKEYDLLILWPHVTYDQTQLVHEQFNAVKEIQNFGKPAKRHLTQEDIKEIMYFNEIEFDHQIIDQLTSAECVGLCYQVGPDFDVETLIPRMCEIIYGEDLEPPGSEESLAKKLEIEIEKEIEEVEEEEVPEEISVEPSSVIGVLSKSASVMPPSVLKVQSVGKSISKVKSAASKSQRFASNLAVKSSVMASRMMSSKMLGSRIMSSRLAQSKIQFQEPEPPPPPPMIAIPGIWTPMNGRTKAMAMKTFFPLVTTKFELPEPEEIPPHLIVAFDAFKKREALELAAEYPKETMRMGFFTTADCNTAELIAKTLEEFEMITAPPYGAKLIIQVSKKSSEPLLSYAVLTPAYVSPNTVIGEQECAIFFPESYTYVDPEKEEAIAKKKKKKDKAPKSDTSSAASTQYQEDGEPGESMTEKIEEEELLGEEETLLGEEDKSTSPMEPE